MSTLISVLVLTAQLMGSPGVPVDEAAPADEAGFDQPSAPRTIRRTSRDRRGNRPSWERPELDRPHLGGHGRQGPGTAPLEGELDLGDDGRDPRPAGPPAWLEDTAAQLLVRELMEEARLRTDREIRGGLTPRGSPIRPTRDDQRRVMERFRENLRTCCYLAGVLPPGEEDLPPRPPEARGGDLLELADDDPGRRGPEMSGVTQSH